MLDFIFRAGDTDYVEKLNKLVSAINLLAAGTTAGGSLNISLYSESHEIANPIDYIVLKNLYFGDVVIVLNGLVLTKNSDFLVKENLITFNELLNEKDIVNIIGIKI